MRIYPVPTGHIMVVEGEHGLLECLSLGDYGKDKNLKADFMGLTKDVDGVPHTELLPLSEKWVVTISTQYGCSTGCKFCDVPQVGRGTNASAMDMVGQVLAALGRHPEVRVLNRLNIHFARMGEPTFNLAVLEAAVWLRRILPNLFESVMIHPVVSTMMPASNRMLSFFLHSWCDLKTAWGGEAGLQLSINTTDEEKRLFTFGGSAMPLDGIGDIVKKLPPPTGRKYTLNFALTGDKIDPEVLYRHFDPEHWLCKITPMHLTNACELNGLHTKGGYSSYAPYRPVEEALKARGYDVIVFVPSIEEDESRITCGNAILADTRGK